MDEEQILDILAEIRFDFDLLRYPEHQQTFSRLERLSRIRKALKKLEAEVDAREKSVNK